LSQVPLWPVHRYASGRSNPKWGRRPALSTRNRATIGTTFEIVPVVPSQETRAVAAPHLDAGVPG